MRLLGLLLIPILFVATACRQPESSSDRRVVSTEDAPEAIGPYSQAIEVGNTVYCSGQIGINPETGEMVSGGVAAQTRQVLDNVEAVLQAAGASLDDVVQSEVYLTNLDDYEAMNEVYSEYFQTAPPARAAVEASRLPAGAHVEIMVTAVK